MENIREEETEPLAASPPRRIAEAYSHNDSRSKMKRCAYYIFFFTSMVCFVMMHLSDNSGYQKQQQLRAQKVLRKKAEIMPEDAVQKIQSAMKHVELDEKIDSINDAHAAYDESYDHNSDSSSDSVDSNALVNDIMKDGDDLDREVKNVLVNVDKAEQSEIDTNNSLITSAVKNLEDSIMYYLGNVFSGRGEYEEYDDDDDMVASTPSSDITLTEKELDVIAKKISERLEIDAKKDFKAKADAVKNEKKVEIEHILEDDTQAKMALRDITKDVKEALPVVVEDLRDEIDEAAEQVKDSLPEKAKQIRDSVVEEVIGQSLNTIEKSKRAKAEKRKQLRKNFEDIVNAKMKKEDSGGGSNDNKKIDTGFPNPNLVTSSSTPEEEVDASDTNMEEEKSDNAKSDNSDDSSDDKKSVDVDGGKEMTPSEKRAKKKKDKIDMEMAKEKEETEEEKEENDDEEEEEVEEGKNSKDEQGEEDNDQQREDKKTAKEKEETDDEEKEAYSNLKNVLVEVGKSVTKSNNSEYSNNKEEDVNENEEDNNDEKKEEDEENDDYEDEAVE